MNKSIKGRTFGAELIFFSHDKEDFFAMRRVGDIVGIYIPSSHEYGKLILGRVHSEAPLIVVDASDEEHKIDDLPDNYWIGHLMSVNFAKPLPNRPGRKRL